MWIFFSNFNFIVNFQYWEMYVAVFYTTPFKWYNSNLSCLCVCMPFQPHLHAMWMFKCQIRVWMLCKRTERNAFLTKPFKCIPTSENGILANHSNAVFKRLIPNRATHHIIYWYNYLISSSTPHALIYLAGKINENESRNYTSEILMGS